MGRLMLASLWSRKRRLLGTATAVLIGVAFLSATLALGDTARAGFAGAFAEATAGTDALVRSETRLTGAEDVVAGPIDAAVLDAAAAVEGVDRVEPVVEGRGQIVAPDGEPIGGDGPPTLAANWIDSPDVNPYRLADGRAPAGPGEIVVDRGSAEAAEVSVGDQVTVLVPEPIEATIVGIATFGDRDNLGGITYAFFTTAEAQRLVLGSSDLLTAVRVVATGGTDPDELVERITTSLPPGVEAITGAEEAEELQADLERDFLGFFTTSLLVFAGIAMLVAALSIYNTFSILGAQRRAETGLLRAIGASRRQVLAASAIESAAIGAIGGSAGAVAGVGLGAALAALLDAAGFGLPVDGIRVEPASVIAALAVGLAVTVAGGLAPAVRASRVAPLAALRDAAVDRSGLGALRLVAGSLVTAAGVTAVIWSTTGAGDLGVAGIGSLLCVIGVVLLGPAAARPVASLLGAPFAARGVTGTLARRNATRNPSRTAGTAAALLIGVGVVTLFTVFASSVAATIEEAVDESFTGDIVVQTGGFSDAGLPAGLARSLEELPEVEAAAGLGFGAGIVDGRHESIAVVDPGPFAAVSDVGGDTAGLSDRGIALSSEYADGNDLEVGDVVSVGFADGATIDLVVEGVLDSRALGLDVTIPTAIWAEHDTGGVVMAVLVDLAAGVPVDAGKEAIMAVTEPLGRPSVLDRDEFVADQVGEVEAILSVIYGLLAVAVLIAVMGIANTLSLSIHERTRELGLLRAVGQSRRQIRAMVCLESVIVASFGAVGGLGLGIFLGWGLVGALAAAEGLGTFRLPSTQLAVVLALGGVAGVAAALRPARRAAKLDVLAALATGE
jgi:putative ABC transport system permease protein